MQLPEHEVIVRDAVFGQPTPDFSSKYVTVVNLYQQSKPSETWDYLVSKVAGFAAVAPYGHQPQSELEQLISKLPDKVLNNFASHKDQLRFLVMGDVDEDEEALRFLEISYGVLPLECLARGNGDPYWYVREMQNLKCDEEEDAEDLFDNYGIGELIHMGIVIDNNVLASKNDLVFLASHMTYGSRTLNVGSEIYDPDDVIAIINLVYDAARDNLKNLRIIRELEDLAVSSMKGILAYLKGEDNEELSDFSEPEEADFDH